MRWLEKLETGTYIEVIEYIEDKQIYKYIIHYNGHWALSYCKTVAM